MTKCTKILKIEMLSIYIIQNCNIAYYYIYILFRRVFLNNN